MYIFWKFVDHFFSFLLLMTGSGIWEVRSSMAGNNLSRPLLECDWWCGLVCLCSGTLSLVRVRGVSTFKIYARCRCHFYIERSHGPHRVSLCFARLILTRGKSQYIGHLEARPQATSLEVKDTTIRLLMVLQNNDLICLQEAWYR